MEYEEDDEEEYDEEYEDNYPTEKTPLETKASVPDPVSEPKKKQPPSIIHTTMKPGTTAVRSGGPHVHSQTSPTQKQTTAVNTDKYRLTQTQNGKTNHVVVVPTTTEKIPDGFSGKVEDDKSKTTLKPTPEPKKYNTRFLPSRHLMEKEKSKQNPDTYVTVTKSVTGSIDDSQTPPVETKHFGSTYYTKTSTCGYFTFSCNIVHGANGRSKICRPKAPSNGKC